MKVTGNSRLPLKDLALGVGGVPSSVDFLAYEECVRVCGGHVW